MKKLETERPASNYDTSASPWGSQTVVSGRQMLFLNKYLDNRIGRRGRLAVVAIHAFLQWFPLFLLLHREKGNSISENNSPANFPIGKSHKTNWVSQAHGNFRELAVQYDYEHILCLVGRGDRATRAPT